MADDIRWWWFLSFLAGAAILGVLHLQQTASQQQHEELEATATRRRPTRKKSAMNPCQMDPMPVPGSSALVVAASTSTHAVNLTDSPAELETAYKMAKLTYDNQRQERDKRDKVSAVLSVFSAEWPCFWGEEATVRLFGGNAFAQGISHLPPPPPI
jgi:hypothetical protein